MNSGPSYTSWSSDSSGCFIDKLSMVISSGKAVTPNSRHTPFPLKTLTTKGMLDSLPLFSPSSSSSFSSSATLGMSTWTLIVSSWYCRLRCMVLSPGLSSISKGKSSGISTWKSYTRGTMNSLRDPIWLQYQKQLYWMETTNDLYSKSSMMEHKGKKRFGKKE